jgi:hypothetical protein
VVPFVRRVYRGRREQGCSAVEHRIVSDVNGLFGLEMIAQPPTSRSDVEHHADLSPTVRCELGAIHSWISAGLNRRVPPSL